MIIKEIYLKAHKQGRIFGLPLDPNPPFDYRARVSFDCFFNAAKGRNRKGDDILYTGKLECEHQSWIDALEKSPSTRHLAARERDIIPLASIWEFYKTIGYDYKAKHYLK